ncbi:hypothetical protein AVEN_123645-1 [Araneus ventricosus]|uniref:Uncharacterized protein n=1 Tax=Araneus ventricosus TaxID=182803 RepID=A0A4Y2GF47_ARAVE|nr:hypothetical protein AVEN_191758-1 [Araneus ventricosus]GBM52318.1 hypothetical protein AVEN_248492-1 [Araneus ventricosus]GBM52424.1 hypothetical protein AVEN_109997-1 [Araneus ventricosus]GBM52452.1 hypothetical protein AVEN_123645-1 [Araneus ventricosus]
MRIARWFGYPTNVDIQALHLDCPAIKRKCDRCKYVGGFLANPKIANHCTRNVKPRESVPAENRSIGMTDSGWICMELSRMTCLKG